MSSSTTLPANTELRNLPASHVHKLGNILQVDEQWADIMGAIPWEEDGSGDRKRFTADEVK